MVKVCDTSRCGETQRRPGKGRAAVVRASSSVLSHRTWSLCFLFQIGSHVAQAGPELAVLPEDDFGGLSSFFHLPSAVVTGIWTTFHWLCDSVSLC